MEKDTKIQSIYLNTAFSENKNLSNPRWILDNSIENVKAVKVKSVSIPLSNYNINQYNNQYKINDSIGSLSVGNYVGSPTSTQGNSFTHKLRESINTLTGESFDITFNTFSNLCILSNTNPFTFQSVGNSIYKNIGITDSQLNNSATSLTSANTLDLSGIKSLNILSQNINAIQLIGLPNYSSLCSIPIDESLNTISTYTDTSNDYIETNSKNISEITLNLKDEFFNPISQLNDWSINLNFITE